MSEYQEAISRLNMPERTPGMMISRASFILPRKDTPENFNRILRETLNTPLPKYSIPQRMFINNQDRIEYTFPLDKQFTLAKGARKSIAIREVNLERVFVVPRLNNVNQNDNLTIDVECNYFINQGGIPLPNQYQLQNHQFQVNRNSISTLYFSKIAKEFFAQVNQDINNNRAQGSPYAGVNPFSYKIDESDHKLFIKNDPEFELIDFKIVIRNQPAAPNANTIPACLLGLYDVNETFTTTAKKISEGNYEVNLEPYGSLFGPFSVCSTMNPWSPGNIICSVRKSYSVLNKLFPYDNTQEVKLWITNYKGDRIRNRIFNGYIDLELIIDNLNNFAMED